MKINLKAVGTSLIKVVKALREHTHLTLQGAKELAESAPCAIDINILTSDMDSKGVQEFLASLIAAGADCEIVGNGFLEDIKDDIENVMRKALDIDDFEILNELIAPYELVKEKAARAK